MGTDSILKAKEHLLQMILSTTDVTNSEHIHTLCHSYEVLVQCEHMSVAIHGKPSVLDFPTDFDLD